MAKQQINLVWLKRDIRTQDHAPLASAEAAGVPYLILYLYEPHLMEYADSSLRHHQFTYHSLLDFNRRMHAYNRSAIIFHEEAVPAFIHLLEQYQVQTVFSYQESGTQITWDRDKAVAEVLAAHNTRWVEHQMNGVERGIRNRTGWDKRWFSEMASPQVENTYTKNSIPEPKNPYPIKPDLLKYLEKYPDVYQPAGETYAWECMESFIRERGKDYRNFISKPGPSRVASGRISPYLAWGNISIKQAYQFVKYHELYDGHKRAFSSFLTRLKWHCHFIQKFEVECDYETVCINRGYELLERPLIRERVDAWKTGTTGYPMVDACMRSTVKTGWLNFRMRAMLVSFLCHHLDQDWRHGAHFLARMFLDYEPGIHYTQFQMQAATTGINTVRMYNPVKQAKDHDPEAEFITEWVPELKDLPLNFIMEPWKMTEMEQELYGVKLGRDYPHPIVDLAVSGKIARQKIYGHRRHPMVREENERILKTHTRNTSARRAQK